MTNHSNTLPILEVHDLVTSFPVKTGIFRRTTSEVQAVSSVSFTIYPGDTMGLVGESGCGKSTVARTILGLEKSKSGSILFEGKDLTNISNKEMQELRKDVQLIFQDPDASLNPRMRVKDLITEPWLIHPGIVDKKDWDQEVAKMMRLVGLNPNSAHNYPHQFSGGQRQRICIARALALRPKLLVCDEAVSALDVSVQAQILNLLQDLQNKLGLAYLFISHDLSVVRHLCNKISVMYLGKIIETGNREDIFESPTHPYTKALLSAVPDPEPWLKHDKEEIILEGDIPSPADPPNGCRFQTRCWKVQDRCKVEEPVLTSRSHNDHYSACHFPIGEDSPVKKSVIIS
ncbi:ATP-binding cassette domain-containing protein [Fictibacillus sp. 7GRE50]|uniref:ABC transporter ATP-binding protein n=1 Tax=Fictibacillus sp. 7GRE50 TaxID=2745878 RepID=UPI0018CF75BE|nr:oligopeptide/dipeptide ABC transporter ATP-binding protein [Fictibacillus sp. 7GRE50]MBH0164226.1 ATP-binding cassette domain-containing protein [Fictibacillus sp. 7GRE50]